MITKGPDGNLWFTEQNGRIGRISPSGLVTEYPTPSASGSPYGIAVGSDGNIWFTETTLASGNRIGRLIP